MGSSTSSITLPHLLNTTKNVPKPKIMQLDKLAVIAYLNYAFR